MLSAAGGKADSMKQLKIADYARRLYSAYGDKAEAVAAQREVQARDSGEDQTAEHWFKIRLAVRGLRA